MNILVTGAAGFIGSHFVFELLRNHDQVSVVGLDKLTYAGSLDNLADLLPREQERFTFVEGDVADARGIAGLFSEYTFTAVVNLAAESHVDRSILAPADFLRTNVIGTQVMLDAARQQWLGEGGWLRGCRFVQVSTDEVYGALGEIGRHSEESPLAPRNPYAASKAAADHLVLAAHNTHGLPVGIVRSSNNYGPRQFPEKLIPRMIACALRHAPLPIYGHGRQVRDWLHVRDHCRAIGLVLFDGQAGRTYNVGGCCERANLSLVHELLDLLRSGTGDAGIGPELVHHVADRPGHDFRYAMDASRIAQELGWQPRVRFADGLAETVAWYLANRSWLDDRSDAVLPARS